MSLHTVSDHRPPEDISRKQVGFRIDPAKWELLRVACFHRRQSVQEVLDALVDSFLDPKADKTSLAGPATVKDPSAWLAANLYAEPTMHNVYVSPALATEMLALNTNNRPVSRRHVTTLANDMTEGRWMETADAIAFDTTGRLLNGQHRLHAVILANIPIPMRVFFGELPETFKVLDTGKSRGAGDILAIGGVVNAHSAAAAVRIDVAIRRGASEVRGVSITPGELSDIASGPEYANLNDALLLRMKVANASGKTLRINSGVTVAALRLMRVNAETDVETFFMEVANGLNISSAQDPVARLRARLINGVSNAVETAALIIKAWNLRAKKQTSTVLTWRTNEPFPEPVRLPGSAL